ncbi:hypothetical protein BX600DRAFT_433387 [Xylariales sp. PMI_506]|nr:hypothetical protein BX600DRAFT_433387 [Xylariales sp. PMI_506]
MEAVADIYNQEVYKGWRALDENPVDAADWQIVLENCRRERMPFIVALSGYRNPNFTVEQSNHKVIGFACLDVASRGIVGSVYSRGKHSARIYVMVKPQLRKCRVGTALIDKIFSLSSLSYNKKDPAYQFIDPWMDPLYDSKSFDTGEYRTLLMEIYVKNLGSKEKTTQGEEYNFIWNFLEDDFQMHLKSHSVGFACAENQGSRIFLDRLIFEHQCRDVDVPLPAN